MKLYHTNGTMWLRKENGQLSVKIRQPRVLLERLDLEHLSSTTGQSETTKVKDEKHSSVAESVTSHERVAVKIEDSKTVFTDSKPPQTTTKDQCTDSFYSQGFHLRVKLHISQKQLKTVRGQLLNAKQQIKSAKKQRRIAKKLQRTVQEKLNTTQEQLETANRRQNHLQSVQREQSLSKQRVKKLQGRLNLSQHRLLNTTSQLRTTQEQLKTVEQKLFTTKEQLKTALSERDLYVESFAGLERTLGRVVQETSLTKTRFLAARLLQLNTGD